jgi:hypothetical protein
MATDLGNVKAATASKNEAFVDTQIERTRRRIRGLDIAFSGLVLAIVTLAYALGMALLDRALELPAGLRLVGFGCFAVFVAAFVTFKLILPFYRPVNPLFAARELERTLPGAKNSVINWLDLRDRNLPAPILGAVGKRAAADVAKADLERAVSARSVTWVGGVAVVLVLAMLVLLINGPGRFWSLMGRAFFPFFHSTIAAETQLTIVKPQPADTTVAVSQPVTITVHAEGRPLSPSRLRGSITLAVKEDEAGDVAGYVNPPGDFDPRAPMLHLRYSEKGSWALFPMEQDGDGDWTVTVPDNRVLNGFYYRVTGGDAQTPIHHIRVEATALVRQIEVTYHYPAFLRVGDRTSDQPNLEGVRGTEVELIVRTNRPVKEGGLEMELAGEKKSLKGELLADDPEAFRCKLTMALSGSYRVQFASKTGESYTGPIPYTIDVVPVSEVTYTYRPYLGWKPQTFQVAHLPSPTALRGTEVAIQYFASRPVKSGRLEMQFGAEKKIVEGKADAGRPEVLRFAFVLDQDGKYGLAYTSQAGETIRDPRSYPIHVLADNPPHVELTKPGKDIELPANDILKLEGSATDDFGLKSLILRMRVVEHVPGDAARLTPLDPKPYRDGKSLKTGAGSYPTLLEYKDFVELEKVTRDKKRFELKPDMVLEYWLEATDNCDYPKKNENGQVAESKHYKVTILKPRPKDEQKKQEEKQQAKNEQKQHEKKQDDKLDKQKEQKKQPEADPNKQKEEQDKKEQEQKKNDAASKVNKEMKKDEPEKKKPDKNGGEDKKGKSKGGEDKQPSKNDRGNTKPPPPDGKQEPQPKKQEKGGEKSAPKDKDGESKSGGKSDEQKNSGESKAAPKDDKSGDNKQGGKEGTRPEQQGNEKGSGDKRPQDTKQEKGGEKSAPKDQNGESKSGGKNDEQKNSGESKAAPKDDKSGDNKQGGKEGTRPEQQGNEKGSGDKRPQEPKQEKGGEKSAPKDQNGECKSGGKSEGQKKDSGQSKGAPKDGKSGDNKQGGKEGTRPEQQGNEKGSGDKRDAGQEKPEKSTAGESKPQPKDMNKTGDEKAGGKPEQAGKEGGAKDAGPKNKEGQPKPSGDSKDKGKPDAKSGAEGAPKAGEKEKKADKPGNEAAGTKSAPKEQGGEAAPKGGGKEEKAKEKAGQEKGGGEPAPMGTEDKKGTAKGEKAPAGKPKEGPKGGADKQPQAKEKGSGPMGGGASGKEKSAPKDDGAAAGTAKDEKKEDDPDKKNGAGADGAKEKKEPTLDDVKKALENARNQDPETRKQAEKDLAEQAHKARDERVRQKAEEALKELGRDKLDPGKAKGKKEEKKNGGPEPMGPKKDEGKAKNGGDKKSDEGKEKKGPEGKAEGDAKNGKQDPKGPPQGKDKAFRPGSGTGAEIPPQVGDKADSDKGSELRLDKNFWDRLAKMSPEERAKLFNKAKLSEDEKNQINEELKARTDKKTTGTAKKPSKKGSLPNQGTKEIKSGDGSGTILSGKGAPPSGFAPVLEKFSRDLRAGTPPKK